MNWLNLLILILVTVGHTEILVTLINRIESLPFPKRVLRTLRLLEDSGDCFVSDCGGDLRRPGWGRRAAWGQLERPLDSLVRLLLDSAPPAAWDS